MRIALVSALVVAGSLVGCGGKNGAEKPVSTPPTAADGQQSFADAMRVFCDAPDKSGAESEDAANKATRLATWITDRLTNEEAKQFFADMGATETSERTKLVEDALAKAEIDPGTCSFYTKILAPAP